MSNFKFNTYSKGFEDYIKLKKRGAILGSGLSKPYNGLQQIDNKSFSRDAISLVLTQNGLTIYDKTTSPLDVFNASVNELLENLESDPTPQFFTQLENLLRSTNISSNIDICVNPYIADYYAYMLSFSSSSDTPIIAFSSNTVSDSQLSSLSTGTGILFPTTYSLTIGNSSYKVNSSGNLEITTNGTITTKTPNDTVLLTGTSLSVSIIYLGAASPGLAVILSSRLQLYFYESSWRLVWRPIANVDKYTVKFYDNQPAGPDFPATTTSVSLTNYFPGYDVSTPMKFYVTATFTNGNPSTNSNNVLVQFGPPLSNVVISEITTTSFKISWDDYDYFGHTIDRVEINANGKFVGEVLYGTPGFKTIYGLTPDTEYEVSIMANLRPNSVTEAVTQTIQTLAGPPPPRPTLFVLTYTAPDRLSWTDFGDGSTYKFYKNNEEILEQTAFPFTFVVGEFTTGVYHMTVTYDTTILTSNDVTIP